MRDIVINMADFQIDSRIFRAIDQLMRHTATRLETITIIGIYDEFLLAQQNRWRAFKNLVTRRTSPPLNPASRNSCSNSSGFPKVSMPCTAPASSATISASVPGPQATSSIAAPG